MSTDRGRGYSAVCQGCRDAVGHDVVDADESRTVVVDKPKCVSAERFSMLQSITVYDFISTIRGDIRW